MWENLLYEFTKRFSGVFFSAVAAAAITAVVPNPKNLYNDQTESTHMCCAAPLCSL